MSFGLSSFARAATLALAALIAWGVCSAQAQNRRRGRAIEFSDPKSSEVLTNLHQLGNRNDGLSQLEEDLFRPLQSFTPTPKGSLDGIVVPPPRQPAGPVIQSKRVKELLERRKNWALMNPEDLLATPSAEELLKVPEFDEDGREKPPGSSVERFYQRLDKQRAKAAKSSAPREEEDLLTGRKRSDSDLAGSPKTEEKLPGALSDREQALRKLFQKDEEGGSLTPTPGRGTLSDIFGLGDLSSTPEQVAAQKARLEEFKKIVGLPASPFGEAPNNPLNTPLNAAADPMRALVNPFAGLPSLPTAAPAPASMPSPFNPSLSGVMSGLGGDSSARGFGAPSLQPTLPKVEPPNVTPPAPNFTMPKRAF